MFDQPKALHRSIQPVYNCTLSTCRRHRDNAPEPPNSCVPFWPWPEHRCRLHRERSSLEALCVLPSGRALTQQMGECRRRTQESDAAHDPSGAALCRDRSEQATQTDPETGPLYGRLQVRMHRFWRAVGPPCYFSGGCWLRGTPKSGASGSTIPHKQQKSPPQPKPERGEVHRGEQETTSAARRFAASASPERVR